MIITISKGELNSVETTLECIGVETVNIQEYFGILENEEEVALAIESLKFVNKLDKEKIQAINDTYGTIVKVTTAGDDYIIWINPEFIKDYSELYRDVTVNLVKSVIDFAKSFRAWLVPLVKPFVDKWLS